MVNGHARRDCQVYAALKDTVGERLRGVGVDRQGAGLRSEVTNRMCFRGEAEGRHLFVKEAVVVVGGVEHDQLRCEVRDEGLRRVHGRRDAVEHLGLWVVLADERRVRQADYCSGHWTPRLSDVGG